jgi:beta-lactamase regulating signal transducer with metallopeptidase domain
MNKSPNRLLGVIFGAVYVVVGLLGFTVTAGAGFFATDGGLLLGIFEVNMFHNVAHLLIGAALLIAGLSNVRAAKATNTTVGAAYLLLGIVGLFIVDSAFNVLALNAADHVLHFASAAVLLGVGLGAEKNSRTVVA